jgi:hypothetical protein
VSAALFLAAVIVAFLAEPSITSASVFFEQNAITMSLAAVQTLEIIGFNTFMFILLVAAWTTIALLMRDSLAHKSPAACIMLATAVHTLFDRLRCNTVLLSSRARPVSQGLQALGRWLIDLFERSLNGR